MIRKKSLLYLLAALLALPLLLCSCEKEKEPPSDPTELDLTAGYQIVRADMTSMSVLHAVSGMNAALHGIGIELPTGTDAVNRKGVADMPETELEILIGLTAREESDAVYETLAENHYAIRTVEKKIVIVGYNHVCTVQALDYFTEHYLTGENAGRIPADLNIDREWKKMYLYQLTEGAGEKYDACVTETGLQGLFNRESENPIYMTSARTTLPGEYFELMTSGDRWMSKYGVEEIKDFDSLLALVRPYLKCVVIWDENVPATMNAATTAAGVEDGVIMTGKQYETYRDKLPEKVIDLRGRFTGEITGSAKNDVYLWALDEYLRTGECGTEHLCFFEDPCFTREAGDIRYAVTRDFAVFHRSFVFDLSTWADEVPKDDLKQKVGTDKDTFVRILSALKTVRPEGKLTEIDGFFSFNKYSSNGNGDGFTSKYVPTHFEWECAFTFTPYGCYWNSVAEYSYNMTVHRLDFPTEPLEQNRPRKEIKLEDNESKVYLLLVMGDYDASGSIYNKMYANWKDKGRGNIPLAWSYNPNLLEEYPDILQYFYETATPNDYFVTNAGAAGWFTPSRVDDAMWDAYLEHNKYYFSLSDISAAPDFWDYQTFSKKAEEIIGQFASTGFGVLVSNQLHRGTGEPATQHLTTAGIPVDPLCNRYVRGDVKACGEGMVKGIQENARKGHATFMATRVIWSTPTYVESCVKEIRSLLPDRDVVVLDPYNYYRMLKESLKNE